jgi:type I restriction enzyme, S subunit
MVRIKEGKKTFAPEDASSMTSKATDRFSVNPQVLPAGWQWIRLGDHVRKIGSGVTPTGGQASYVPNGIPLIRSQNVHMNRFEYSGLAYITTQQDAAMEGSRVVPNDLLLNITGASIGRVCVVPPNLTPANVNQHVSIIRLDASLSPDFLSYYIAGPPFQKIIANSQAGATRQALTKALIENFRIAAPALHEQQRIAAILRDQMAAVERARIAAANRVEAANGFVAAFLRSFFVGPKTNRWPSCRLGDVLDLRREIVHPRDKPRGQAVFVGLEHIESGTGRRLGSQTVLKEELSGRKPEFHKGDIVYGYLRPNLNKVWVADFDGLCSVDQYVFMVNAQKADHEFLAWFMRSPVYLERAPVEVTPGYLPRIRTEEVAATPINLPPVKEQIALAVEIAKKIEQTFRLVDAIQKQIAAINAMPAAFLRSAFNGEL